MKMGIFSARECMVFHTMVVIVVVFIAISMACNIIEAHTANGQFVNLFCFFHSIFSLFSVLAWPIWDFNYAAN